MNEILEFKTGNEKFIIIDDDRIFNAKLQCLHKKIF